MHEIDFISNGDAPPVPRGLLGPGFRQVSYEKVGALRIRRYALPGPDVARLRLRKVDDASSTSARSRVLLDGMGRADAPDRRCGGILSAQVSPARRRYGQSASRASQTADRATEFYSTARQNPYVQKLIEDEELRDSLKNAFEAARGAYSRATGNGHSPVKAVTSDKKVQKDLRSAAENLREASERLQAPKKRRRAASGA